MTIDKIKARNYNLDSKNPNSADAAHGDPVLLLEKYRSHQAEIATLRAQLKSGLENTLKWPPRCWSILTTCLPHRKMWSN
jgi:type I restriction enzyme M protein